MKWWNVALTLVALVFSVAVGNAWGVVQYTVTDLGTLGGTDSFAYRINDSGQVVGQTITSSGTYRAFLYSGGVMTDLGTLGGSVSWAFDINAGGQVVGYTYTSEGAKHAFLYSAGAMSDLNSLISDGSGWILEEARAIDDVGQIAGQGYSPSGQHHAFLLTPIPPGVLRLLHD